MVPCYSEDGVALAFEVEQEAPTLESTAFYLRDLCWTYD